MEFNFFGCWQSMECTVVTTDAGGIKEVIRHEQDGLMVSVDAWQKLSEELGRLASDNALRNRLAKGARQRVEEQFSLKRMVGELEELYLPLTPSRGG